MSPDIISVANTNTASFRHNNDVIISSGTRQVPKLHSYPFD